jgi:hypothetical protein
LLPANFAYFPFALILLIMGLGNGIFMSPNMASVMNSVPAEHRGVASGMRGTLQNCGQTISQALFFAIIIISLNATLPAALSAAVTNAGAPAQFAAGLANTPASGALFAAFLGYNPIGTMLSGLSPSLTASLTPAAKDLLTGQTFFPNAIATPFMGALTIAFYIAAIMCFAAAVFSALRGKKQVYEEKQEKEISEKKDSA